MLLGTVGEVTTGDWHTRLFVKASQSSAVRVVPGGSQSISLHCFVCTLISRGKNTLTLFFTPPQSPITKWGALVAGGLKPPPMPWRRRRDALTGARRRGVGLRARGLLPSHPQQASKTLWGVWGPFSQTPRKQASERERERESTDGHSRT